MIVSKHTEGLAVEQYKFNSAQQWKTRNDRRENCRHVFKLGNHTGWGGLGSGHITLIRLNKIFLHARARGPFTLWRRHLRARPLVTLLRNVWLQSSAPSQNASRQLKSVSPSHKSFPQQRYKCSSVVKVSCVQWNAVKLDCSCQLDARMWNKSNLHYTNIQQQIQHIIYCQQKLLLVDRGAYQMTRACSRHIQNQNQWDDVYIISFCLTPESLLLWL